MCLNIAFPKWSNTTGFSRFFCQGSWLQDGPKMGPRGPKIDRYTNNNANININIVLNVINFDFDFDSDSDFDSNFNLQTTDNRQQTTDN